MEDYTTATKNFFEIVRTYTELGSNTSQKVLNYMPPDQLKKAFDVYVNKDGISFEKLLSLFQQYLEYSVNTGNHQFFNQLYAGFNLPAFMGEVITALTNTSMYTYEVAPLATMIEKEMISKMCSIIGYLPGDGIFVTGGSNANLVAMFSARNKLFPNIKSEGIYGLPKLSVFVSEDAHYSFENNANLLGLGSSCVYKVKTDARGRMKADDLEKNILISKEKGEQPFFIGATAGTTLLGAFDPFEEITKIGKKHQIWVHIDGSFGGSLILSAKTKHLFKGIENSDSFAWNPHKLMNIPLICSVILLREKDRLHKNLTNYNGDYIFHETESASCDLGKKSIQCGRKVDALKLWAAWKFYGDSGYEKRINNLLHAAEYFEQNIIADKRFELMVPRQSLTVCFRYLPENKKQINDINLRIREELRKSGLGIVNFGFLKNDFVFRWVVANAEVNKSDIDVFFSNFVSVIDEIMLDR